ncbi:hypothetical protein TcasGA2_TC013677 [Tribolium castaneum]|uniref:E3 ubiquitin-protein ligase PPP1R11 n=1 Tax=Tribolium castaneum TaxID=7070 RepID=D6WKE0_TRICA|nr:hypothetical protein TcasGA2_TC013677 [Tribolium castaneum]
MVFFLSDWGNHDKNLMVYKENVARVNSDNFKLLQDHEVPTLKLRLTKPKSDRKVEWTTETVDNEHMNKKKSKCCCIYKKPRNFDESSSEEGSDDECEHCKGHVEKKKKRHQTQDDSNTDGNKGSDESILNNNNESHEV